MTSLLYRPVFYLHILATFTFMLCHGASAVVAFRLRHETSRDRIRALLDLSGYPYNLMLLSLAIVILGGVAMGFLGHWWARGWIWVLLVVLIAIGVAMSILATGHFHRIRKAVGLPYLAGYKEHPPVEPAPPEEIAGLIASGRPYLIALIGLGGWAVVLWLVIFKPF